MSETTIATLRDPSGFSPDPLTEILRSGARDLIQQAVEAELAALLETHTAEKTEEGHARLVRHGHLPEREVMTGLGPVPVTLPRVRDRGAGVEKIRFTSAILPPYLRKAKSVEELLPWLYLKGISTGDFQEALAALLGPNAAGLSSSTISRLTKVKRLYEDFEYQAASWDKPRRVIAKIEWHPGELFPHVGFIVTNLPMEPDWVVRFYNQRGTAEQHIKEGKYAFRWTRLSCRKFCDNEVRLQLHALAYNLATFLRCIELPEAMAEWSLTSLQLKLIKIGARVVRHARAITFQLAEVAVTGPMVRAILATIRRLRAPPLCA